MEPLIIEATKNTPGITFRPSDGTFRVDGTSIPEDASMFYRPVLDWLSANLATLPGGRNFTFDLHYFNSSSLKAIHRVLTTILAVPGGRHTITWEVDQDDEFTLDAAETFSEMLGMPLNVVPKAG